MAFGVDAHRSGNVYANESERNKVELIEVIKMHIEVAMFMRMSLRETKSN